MSGLRAALIRLNADELTRVHDAVRVESALHQAHQLDLDRLLVMGDLVPFEPPDAVFGADRAGELAHNAVDDVVELLPACNISMPVRTFGLGQVKMDVAVADMAKGHRSDPWQSLGNQVRGAVDEVGDPADRHRDIVLDRARIILRFDNRLADMPELLCLCPALGDDPVADETFFKRYAEQYLQQPADPALPPARRHFKEHVPRIWRVERIDGAGNVDEGEFESSPRDQLEGCQLVGGCGTRFGEQAHRVLDPAEAEKRRLDLTRLGKELDRRGGDDAEGALTTDKELLQIVTGIVLAQCPQPVPDPPVGQYDLEAQGQLAGIAIAQHRDAAGVGREIAADLAASLRAEAQREQPVSLGGGLLQIGEDAPGLDRHRKIDRVDRAAAGHASDYPAEVLPVLGRDPAADEAGIAALRHDRQLRFGADPCHRRHRRGRGRADDEPGGTAVESRASTRWGSWSRGSAIQPRGPTAALIRSMVAAISMLHSFRVQPCRSAAAARRKRSLIARPSPCSGIGITAMPANAGRSSRRSIANRFAAASARSPERLSHSTSAKPGGAFRPKASRASPG